MIPKTCRKSHISRVRIGLGHVGRNRPCRTDRDASLFDHVRIRPRRAAEGRPCHTEHLTCFHNFNTSSRPLHLYSTARGLCHLRDLRGQYTFGPTLPFCSHVNLKLLSRLLAIGSLHMSAPPFLPVTTHLFSKMYAFVQGGRRRPPL